MLSIQDPSTLRHMGKTQILIHGIVLGPLNFGFPAFRNVDVLLYLCASFWALMSFLQSETHSSYRVKQISGQQQPPSLSFIELSGGKKIWGICFNPETTAQLLSH